MTPAAEQHGGVVLVKKFRLNEPERDNGHVIFTYGPWLCHSGVCPIVYTVFLPSFGHVVLSEARPVEFHKFHTSLGLF